MTRDTLFQKGHTFGKFEFNEQVADVFDDMLDRSVPFYEQVIKMITRILGQILQDGDTVYDLGCSTGATLLELVRSLDPQKYFLKKIHACLRRDGALILSEKVICQDDHLNQAYLESYHQYKKERGYSELEIANKREALEDVLIPLTIQKNCDLLLEAGFRNVETFFQWFNFVSIVAVK